MQILALNIMCKVSIEFAVQSRYAAAVLVADSFDSVLKLHYQQLQELHYQVVQGLHYQQLSYTSTQCNSS